MSETTRTRTAAVVVAAVLGSVMLAGGVYWTVHASGPDLEDDLGSGNVDRMRSALLAADTETFKGEEGRERRRLTVETMRQMPVEDLMALWRSKDLTDEERELLGRNMRAVWMGHMNEMADEYFAASDQDKPAILDRRIDEFMEFRDRMREYRESQQDQEDDEEEREQRREEMRRRWRSPSKEERKERMAETDPDQQAKMFYMFSKMRERAQERGIDFGWGAGRGGGHGGQTGPRDRDSPRDRDRDRDSGRRGG